jgi:hypothetical protein
LPVPHSSLPHPTGQLFSREWRKGFSRCSDRNELGHGVRGSGGLISLRHGLPRFAEIVADVPPRRVCSNVDTPTGTRDAAVLPSRITNIVAIRTL